MKPQKCTIYRCDFCREHRLSAVAARNHEKYCKHNPENKHKCFTCEHLQVTEEIVNGRKAKRFTCAALDRALYSYKAEKRGLHLECQGGPIPDNAYRMPNQCPAHMLKLIGEPAEIPF